MPSAFNPLPEGSKPDRLGLAKWLVDPNHPLTSRVAVNRIWERFFGMTGIELTGKHIDDYTLAQDTFRTTTMFKW